MESRTIRLRNIFLFFLIFVKTLCFSEYTYEVTEDNYKITLPDEWRGYGPLKTDSLKLYFFVDTLEQTPEIFLKVIDEFPGSFDLKKNNYLEKIDTLIKKNLI